MIDASIAYLLRQIDAGVEVVQIFDSWAGVLPANEFARWSAGPIARIVAALSQHPLFFSAALPWQVYPPLFNRYADGMHFGHHVDGAIRTHAPGGLRLRADLSATLFTATNPVAYGIDMAFLNAWPASQVVDRANVDRTYLHVLLRQPSAIVTVARAAPDPSRRVMVQRRPLSSTTCPASARPGGPGYCGSSGP